MDVKNGNEVFMNATKFIKLSSCKEVFASCKRNDLCMCFENSESLTMSDIEFLQDWLIKHRCKLKNKVFYILTGKLFNKALSHYSNAVIYNENNDEFFGTDNLPYTPKITEYEKNHLQKLVDDNKKDSGYTDDTIFLLIRLSDISNITPLQNSDKFNIGLYWFGDIYESAYEKCYDDDTLGLLTQKIY